MWEEGFSFKAPKRGFGGSPEACPHNDMLLLPLGDVPAFLRGHTVHVL